MTVKLLTERHFRCLSLKGGCTGSSSSLHVKMSNCWKSYAAAQFTLITSHKFVSFQVTKAGSQSQVIHPCRLTDIKGTNDGAWLLIIF